MSKYKGFRYDGPEGYAVTTDGEVGLAKSVNAEDRAAWYRGESRAMSMPSKSRWLKGVASYGSAAVLGVLVAGFFTVPAVSNAPAEQTQQTRELEYVEVGGKMRWCYPKVDGSDDATVCLKSNGNYMLVHD